MFKYMLSLLLLITSYSAYGMKVEEDVLYNKEKGTIVAWQKKTFPAYHYSILTDVTKHLKTGKYTCYAENTCYAPDKANSDVVDHLKELIAQKEAEICALPNLASLDLNNQSMD